MPFEVRVDCPSCRVEGARIETWETVAASCRLGLPLATRCRLCGHGSEGRVAAAGSPAPGEGCPACGDVLDEASLAAHRCPFCGASAAAVETSPARLPASPGELDRALASWAAAEELESAAELVDAYFVLPTPAAIAGALARGEVVETTFDVVDYLFSSSCSHGEGTRAVQDPATRVAIADAPPPTSPMVERPSPFFHGGREHAAVTTGGAPPGPPASVRQPASLRRVGGPRDELYALASVAASDGEASPNDLEVLARAAQVRGLLPLALDEIRVRRPFEIDPPPTLVQREKLLEEMFWMAWSDEELDESEVRVVRDFARAWGVDPQRVTEWTAVASSRGSSKIARWLDRVGYFLFPGW